MSWFWGVVSALCADSFEPQARRYNKFGHCPQSSLTGGQGVEKNRFKGAGEFHHTKMRQDFFIEHNLFVLLRVRRTEGDPASDADIIEHLQQPFDFRPGERELKAGSRRLKASGFVQHGPDVFPILLPLGGE